MTPDWKERAREIALIVSGVSPDEHNYATCDLRKLQSAIAALAAEAYQAGLEERDAKLRRLVVAVLTAQPRRVMLEVVKPFRSTIDDEDRALRGAKGK